MSVLSDLCDKRQFMKDSSFNMTTGKPLKNILIFAIPIMLSNLIQQCYNVADTYIVGQYISANALAAVGSIECDNLFYRRLLEQGTNNALTTMQEMQFP